MIVSNKIKYNYFIKLLFLLVIPSLAYVLFNLSSLSIGLLLTCLLLLIFNNNKIYIKDIKGWPLLVLHIFFGFEFFKTIYLGLSLTTLLQIYLSFVIILLIAQNLVYSSVNINFRTNLKYVYYVLICILLINIFNIQIGRYYLFQKSIFPFSEPSHLVINFGYFLPTIFYLQKKIMRFALVLFLLFFAFYFESLLFVLIVFASYLFTNRINLKLLFSILLIFVLLYFVFVNYNLINLDYYLNRLDFKNLNNISLLVFLQGWEIIITTLKDFNLIGVGLNNLKSVPFSEVADQLYTILGEYKNREDGGFLAAKIIGETGIAGFVMILIYIKIVYSKLKNATKEISLLNFFYSSILFISLFELFFRGMGYFTIGTILTTSSLIYFKTND